MRRSNCSSFRRYDTKGLPFGVGFNGVPLKGWLHYGVELGAEHIDQMSMHEVPGHDVQTSGQASQNTAYLGRLVIEKDKMAGGTFIDMTNFKKGYVWINSINLGRYWTPKGPQLTLFVPGGFLNVGNNTIIVFEIDGSGNETLGVDLIDSPKLLSKKYSSSTLSNVS